MVHRNPMFDRTPSLLGCHPSWDQRDRRLSRSHRYRSGHICPPMRQIAKKSVQTIGCGVANEQVAASSQALSVACSHLVQGFRGYSLAPMPCLLMVHHHLLGISLSLPENILFRLIHPPSWNQNSLTRTPPPKHEEPPKLSIIPAS